MHYSTIYSVYYAIYMTMLQIARQMDIVDEVQRVASNVHTRTYDSRPTAWCKLVHYSSVLVLQNLKISMLVLRCGIVFIGFIVLFIIDYKQNLLTLTGMGFTLWAYWIQKTQGSNWCSITMNMHTLTLSLFSLFIMCCFFGIIYTMSSKQACGVHKMIAFPLHNLS